MGRATGDAYAVAIRIVEQGSGYWLKPVGIEDPTLPGELTFEFSFDAASEIAAGRNTFAAVAFDKDGRAGKTLSDKGDCRRPDAFEIRPAGNGKPRHDPRLGGRCARRSSGWREKSGAANAPRVEARAIGSATEPSTVRAQL